MSTSPKSKPAALPKPRVTPSAGDHRSWSIDFGNGATATMNQPWDMRRERFEDAFTWTVTFADGRSAVTGQAYGQRLAFECAWCCAAKASTIPPVNLSRAQLEAIIHEAEGSSIAATKAIRKILKLRTGFAWSARVGKGTAGSWLTVASAPKRHDRDHMTGHDCALLSLLAGESHVCRSGISVRPGSGVRAALIWDLAGLERPADLRIASPSWD